MLPPDFSMVSSKDIDYLLKLNFQIINYKQDKFR
jgi:hypothetical protein